MKDMGAVGKGQVVAGDKAADSSDYSRVKSIVIACDAGVGTSVMGATMLRKQIAAAGLDIQVSNKAINNLDGSEDMVITQKLLSDRAREVLPNAIHLSIGQFLDKNFYAGLIEDLQKARQD